MTGQLPTEGPAEMPAAPLAYEMDECMKAETLQMPAQRQEMPGKAPVAVPTWGTSQVHEVAPYELAVASAAKLTTSFHGSSPSCPASGPGMHRERARGRAESSDMAVLRGLWHGQLLAQLAVLADALALLLAERGDENLQMMGCRTQPHVALKSCRQDRRTSLALATEESKQAVGPAMPAGLCQDRQREGIQVSAKAVCQARGTDWGRVGQS